MSGVINIVTKTPVRQQNQQQSRSQFSGQFGNKGDLQVSYGGDGRLSDQIDYRISLYHTQFDQEQRQNLPATVQHKSEMQLTFRWLKPNEPEHRLYLGAMEGNHTNSAFVPSMTPPFLSQLISDDEIKNSYFNYQYINELSSSEHLEMQLIYDGVERAGIDGYFDLETWEGKYRQGLRWGQHSLQWGLSYRHQQDHYINDFVVAMLPPTRSYKILSGFIQDLLPFDADRGEFSFGIKYEDATRYSDKLQPSLRVSYLTTPDTYWWLAVSRAYRAPARSEQSLRLNFAVFPNPFGQVTAEQFVGNSAQQSEKLQAWEIGVRSRMKDNIVLEISAFYHDYERLLSFEPLPPHCFTTQMPLPCEPTDIVVNAHRFGNDISGKVKGIELQLDYRINQNINLSTSLSLITQGFAPSESSLDTAMARRWQNSVPRRALKTRLDWDLTEQLQWTLSVYYASALETQLIMSDHAIDEHWRVDSRLSHKLTENLEIYLSGQNLLDPKHVEYTANDGTVPTEIQRSLAIGFDWWF